MQTSASFYRNSPSHLQIWLCFMYRSELSTHARRSPVINIQVNIARFRGHRIIPPLWPLDPQRFAPSFLKKKQIVDPSLIYHVVI